MRTSFGYVASLYCVSSTPCWTTDRKVIKSKEHFGEGWCHVTCPSLINNTATQLWRFFFKHFEETLDKIAKQYFVPLATYCFFGWFFFFPFPVSYLLLIFYQLQMVLKEESACKVWLCSPPAQSPSTADERLKFPVPLRVSPTISAFCLC